MAISIIKALSKVAHSGSYDDLTDKPTSSSNYIRMPDGVQICWGSGNFASGATTQQVSLPKAFKNTSYVASVTLKHNANATENVTALVKETGKISINALVRPTAGYEYIAIGLWK